MALFTREEFREAGWTTEDELRSAAEELADLEARGVGDRAYALKLLRRKLGGDGLLARRAAEDAAPLACALEATPGDDIEETNLAAVRRTMGELLRVPVVERGVLMPDACPVGPAEAMIPVGGVVAVNDALIPSATGSDICCSVSASYFPADDGQGERDPKALLDALLAATRFGPGGRPTDDLVPHAVLDEPVWDNPFLKGLSDHARIHMADQGDGNHFAYLGRFRLAGEGARLLIAAGHADVAEQMAGRDFYSVVTHHGSRGLGAHLFKRGQNAALKHTKKIAKGIPDAAAWLDATDTRGLAYWDALQYVGRWTKANHESIHRRFLESIGASPTWHLWSPHNFVWKRGHTFLHGKGATPAWADASGNPLLGLIPLNMAEPILLVAGSGNQDYLSFCPHGAGRNQSRSAVLRDLRRAHRRGGPRIDEVIARATDGIDVRWFSGKADVTETPIGYKNAAHVRAQIEKFGLAEIVGEIDPIGSIMAGKSLGRDETDLLTPKQKRQMEQRKNRRRDRQRIGSGDWGEE